jgi:hypothetical protein
MIEIAASMIIFSIGFVVGCLWATRWPEDED